MYRSRPVVVPVFQEIHIPKRDYTDLVVVALIDPEVVFQPVQDLVVLGIEIGSGIGHHKTDTSSGIAHILIVSRVCFRHQLAPDQHIRRLEDGVAKVFKDAAHGQLYFLCSFYIFE